MPRSVPAPALGERRAVRGLAAQYKVAAELIYDAILSEELEWIRVADPEAGRVDDIQIARPGRLDAYQVKWSEYEDRVTLSKLVNDDAGGATPKPSLMRQLADGWDELTPLYPDRTVHVHLVTRSSPSSDDNVGGPRSNAHPAHLQAFLRIAYVERADWAQECGSAVATDWGEPIERLRAASGLTVETFATFIQCCHFDFDFALTSLADDGQRSTRQRLDDVQSLADYLLKAVADDRRLVQIARTDLLKALGWNRRFDLRFRHDFPVDEHLYQPVRETVEALEQAFGSLCSGYLALVGPPGSGKSTTLTQMLRYREGVRVVRYYAFVPQDTHQVRGEAGAFLHDVCLSLRRFLEAVGRGNRGAAMPIDREGLAAELGRLMRALHEDWRRTGRITLILVDGLDHIEREQNPVRSLLNDLPLPQTIPEGVLFVLGTQPVGLESLPMAKIRGHIASPGRTIPMAQLDRGAVWEIATAARPAHEWPKGALQQVYRLSDGHPLALRYLLARLATVDPDEIPAVLADTNPFRGDIEDEYQRYWEAFREDSELRDVLGLACRLRGSIDLDVLLDLTPARPVIERLVRSARHFFREDTARRWTFFHNSFRLFLLRITALDPFGRDDPALAAEHHRRLAAAAARARSTSPFSWELIHHLASAGNHAAVLDAFTQELFRHQFFAMRPLGEIVGDIGLCLEAAAQQVEPIAVIRGLLIEHELRERSQALEDIDLPSLLLELAPSEEIADAAIRGTELKVPVKTALALADRLASLEEVTLARRLFDAAEPLDLLRGAQPLRSREQRDHLESWVRVAWQFRPLKDLLDLLDQIQPTGSKEKVTPSEDDVVIEEELGEDQEAALTEEPNLDQQPEEHWISNDLMRVLAVELLEKSESDLAKVVEERLRDRGNPSANVALATLDYRRARLAADGRLDLEFGREAFRRAMAAYPPSEADLGAAVAFAEVACRLGNMQTEAEACLAPVVRPLIVSSLERAGGSDLQDLTPLLRQARVLAALGKPLDPAGSVGAVEFDRDQGTVLLQRIIVVIGTLLGEADVGRVSQPAEVVRRLRPAIYLFRRSIQETRDWHDWYLVEQRAPGLFLLTLEVAHAHGPRAFAEIVAAFIEDWTRPRAGRVMGWRPAWKRSIILEAYQMDGNVERTAEWLARLEADIDIQDELEERVTGYQELARGWLTINELDRARACLDRMIQTSFAVYHRKDDQLQRWALWADRFARSSAKADASAALYPLFRALSVVHEARRGRDQDTFTARLLETAGGLSPSWGRELTDWLIQEGASSWEAALTGLIRGFIRADPVSSQAVSACLIVAARLLVPVATDCDTTLAQGLGRAATAAGTSSEVQEALAQLLDSIYAEAFSSNRNPWLEALAEGCRAAGGNPADCAIPAVERTRNDLGADRTASPSATLTSGGCIAEDMMVREAGQPGRLQTLLGEITAVHRVNWTAVVEAALPHIRTPTALCALRAQLLRFDLSLDAEARLAEHAVHIGDRREATRTIDRMVERTKVSGWYRSWDGGTRQMVARCMGLVLGDEGRRRALELFVRDYQTEGLHPRDLLRDLDELVEILLDAPPIATLWREIEEHVLQLAEVREAPDRGVPHYTAGSDLLGPLVRFTLARLDHPISSIANGALRAVIQLVTSGSAKEEVSSELGGALRSGDDTRQSTALSVLLCLESDAIAAELVSAIEALCHAPSAQVSRMSHALMRRLGRTISAPQRTEPLPAIYQLQLPEAPMRQRSLFGTTRAPGEALPDTTDSIELASLYMPILEDLVGIAGVSLEALAHRLKTLMESLAPSETWDRASEEKLQAKVNALDLPMAYRRPRSTIAHRAFSHLIGELRSAGRVPWPYDPLTEWLLTVDPVTSQRNPAARPKWLVAPNAEEMGKYPQRNWTDHPGEAFSSSPKTTPDGGLVLGELTIDKRHDRGMPEEAKATMIAHADWPLAPDDTPEHGFFYERTSFSASDYPRLLNLKPMPTAVVKGGGRFVPRFLALNPALGQSMEWNSSSEGLFRWIDREGNIMVESLRWQDGNREHLATLGGAERSGDGWLVVTTPAGAKHLNAKLKNFKRFLMAARSVQEEGENNEQTQVAYTAEAI